MSQVNNYPSTSRFNSDDSVLITGATSGLRRFKGFYCYSIKKGE